MNSLNRLKQSQAGFTIIETVLFLAISGTLFIIVFTGIGNRNETVRFSQSMRALEATLQKELAAVQNGTADGATPPAPCAGECLFLGRVLEFTPDSADINIHTIWGDRLAPGPTPEPALDLVDTSPRKQTTVSNTSEIEWGGVFREGEMTFHPSNVLNESADNRLVGYIRLPNSTEIIPAGFSAATGVDSVLNDSCQYDLDSSVNCAVEASTIKGAFDAKLCIESPDGQFAHLVLGGNENRLAITIDHQGRDSCV